MRYFISSLLHSMGSFDMGPCTLQLSKCCLQQCPSCIRSLWPGSRFWADTGWEAHTRDLRIREHSSQQRGVWHIVWPSVTQLHMFWSWETSPDIQSSAAGLVTTTSDSSCWTVLHLSEEQNCYSWQEFWIRIILKVFHLCFSMDTQNMTCS